MTFYLRLRSIVTFCLWCMLSEITRFYCKPDMTSLWFLRQGALQTTFHDGFWKSDHEFLIVFHSNFLTGMHGFRDNEVLLPTGNVVIVISSLGGVSHRFCWRNLKERPKFHNDGSLTYFAYLLPFRSYSTLPIPYHFRGVFRVKHPQITQLHISNTDKGLPQTRTRLLSYCARKLVHRYWL